MKKLLIIAFLALGMGVSAQPSFRFIDKEYFTFSAYVDPSASIKESGLNIGAELEVVSYAKYVKIGLQSFTVLEGGYTDLTGGVGVNVTSGNFDQYRAYAGGRLGLVNRGKFIYPLVGAEGGVDLNIGKMFIGVRATADYRSDFVFTDGVAQIRYSGFVRVGAQF